MTAKKQDLGFKPNKIEGTINLVRLTTAKVKQKDAIKAIMDAVLRVPFQGKDIRLEDWFDQINEEDMPAPKDLVCWFVENCEDEEQWLRCLSRDELVEGLAAIFPPELELSQMGDFARYFESDYRDSDLLEFSNADDKRIQAWAFKGLVKPAILAFKFAVRDEKAKAVKREGSEALFNGKQAAKAFATLERLGYTGLGAIKPPERKTKAPRKRAAKKVK